MGTHHGRTLPGIGGWFMSKLPPVEYQDLPKITATRSNSRQRRKALLPSLVWAIPMLVLTVTASPAAYARVLLIVTCLSIAGIIPLIIASATSSLIPLYVYMMLMVAVVMYGLFWVVRHPRQYDGGIAGEERDCREGAELWTPAERVKACLIFGAIHLRLLVTPVLIVVTGGIIGALLMHEYLMVFRRTGSRHAALQASTTLHITTNDRSLAVLLAMTLVVSIIMGVKFFL